MASVSAVLVYVTASSREEADSLAGMAVEKRLAACADVLPGVRSTYRWRGAVERADEVALILKTTEARVDELTAALKRAHSYECPCVVALPITGGNADFLAWIAAETDASSPKP